MKKITFLLLMVIATTMMAQTDVTSQYQIKTSDDDLTEMLETWHSLCVSDTLAKGRQKWYNRDEMLVAFECYDEASSDKSKMQTAIELMQTAHGHYIEITDSYKSLRSEAIALYTQTSKSKFALRSSVSSIRRDIISYYSRNEDHYEWVKKTLPELRAIADMFEWYGKLGKTISIARNQCKATDYEGKEVFTAAMSEAYRIQTTATETTDFQKSIADIQEAQTAYLKQRPSEWITIQNGKLWRTTTGATVQAHAPGFVRVGDIWYMCGEDRSNSWNPDVNLYSSTDLITWKFEKKIIQNGVTTSELGSSRMIERPKLMYNSKTDKYVVWCHYEASNYGASEAACFECDSVNGAYKYVWSGRPLNIKSRDCNVFQDTDGTAYFISTTEENRHLGLFRLSNDYHEAVEHTELFSWQGREAPAIVKIGNRYFMFNSACSGWDPNQCKMSYTTNLKNGWSNLDNVGNPIAYDTQAAAILEIKGTRQTTYLYVGDRWQDPDLPNTKTIIFPITFNGTRCEFKYHERFDINFVTGEWRETPTDEIFADKKDWKVIEYSSQETSSENSPARNAIDGNVNTKWHTKYSGTTAAAPHYITIDMGRERTIKGFLATPRMDDSTNGLIRKYEFQVSTDGETWKTVIGNDWLPYCTEVTFAKRQCRYIKLICKEGTYASLAELDVIIDKETETDIENVCIEDSPEKTTTHRTFFALNGSQITEPTQGIYIEKEFYTDGTSKSIKKLSNR